MGWVLWNYSYFSEAVLYDWRLAVVQVIVHDKPTTGYNAAGNNWDYETLLSVCSNVILVGDVLHIVMLVTN